MCLLPQFHLKHYFTSLLLAVLPSGSSALAGTTTFDGGPSGSGTLLDTAANWVGDTLPTTSDEVLFNNSVLSPLPVSMATTATQTWGNIIWDTNDSSALTLTGAGSARTLFLSGNAGSTAAIAAGGATEDLITLGTNKTSGTLTISNTDGTTGTSRLSLNLSALTGNFNVVNSGATLAISAELKGMTAANSVLTKTGAGTLTLSNGNNALFSSSNSGRKFVLAGGTLNFTTGAGFSGNNGGSTLEIQNGTFLDNSSAGAIVLNANNTQSWTGNFTYKGSGNSLNLGTGAVTLSSNRTVTVNASTLTVGGAIADGGNGHGLVKEGAGALVLTGASNYGGSTIVNGGTLQIGGGADRLPAGTEVILANGTNSATSGILNLAGQNQTVTGLSSSGSGATKGSVRNTTTATTATLTITGTSTFDGILRDNSGSGTGKLALTKSIGGTLTLTGVNTYTGSTMITGGTLIVNGSLAAGSAVSLGSGTLGGSGSIAGTVTTSGANSILSPGNSPGTLTLSGGLDATAGARFTFELGTTADLLSLGSGLFTGSSSANGLIFDFSNSGGLTAETPYTLLTFGSSLGLESTDLFANTLPSGFALDTSFGSNGFLTNSGNLQVQFTAVPEPSTCLLLGLGMVAMLIRKRGN